MKYCEVLKTNYDSIYVLFKQYVIIYHTALVSIKGQTFVMNIKSQSLISRGLTIDIRCSQTNVSLFERGKNTTQTKSEFIGEYSTVKEYGLKIQKSSRHLK